MRTSFGRQVSEIFSVGRLSPSQTSQPDRPILTPLVPDPAPSPLVLSSGGSHTGPMPHRFSRMRQPRGILATLGSECSAMGAPGAKRPGALSRRASTALPTTAFSCTVCSHAIDVEVRYMGCDDCRRTSCSPRKSTAADEHQECMFTSGVRPRRRSTARALHLGSIPQDLHSLSKGMRFPISSIVFLDSQGLLFVYDERISSCLSCDAIVLYMPSDAIVL